MLVEDIYSHDFFTYRASGKSRDLGSVQEMFNGYGVRGREVKRESRAISAPKYD